MMGEEWREISVTIPGEAREAVANFLMECGSSGIVFEDAERGGGFETIKAYFPSPFFHEVQSISRYLEAIREFFPGVCPSGVEIRSVPDRDWMVRWKAFFKASRVGRRIIVKPPWIRVGSRKMIVIDIDPGMAFGTGTHPTTRLCLHVLEELIGGVSESLETPPSVLDVGTGSGILSIAAVKLGARRVVGIDIDQRALENARKNIRINRLKGKIRLRRVTIFQLAEHFDVVVVNIDAGTVEDMRDHLRDRIAKGGTLILSGILDGEVEAIKRRFTEGSFSLGGISREDGWACLTLERI
jgi:ribosomal protein L11 methyltransferase